MPHVQKLDIFFSFLIVQIYSNGYIDCNNNVEFDYAKVQL